MLPVLETRGCNQLHATESPLRKSLNTG